MVFVPKNLNNPSPTSEIMQSVVPLIILEKASSRRGYSPTLFDGSYHYSTNSNNHVAISRGDNVAGSIIGNDREVTLDGEYLSLDTLYKTVQQSPEVTGVIRLLVNDIMSDGYVFKGTKGAINKSEKFAKQIHFYKKLSDALWDLLITGDAFILKLAFNEDEIKSIVSSRIDFSKFKEPINKNVFLNDITKKLMQNFNKTKGLQVLKSSSVTIVRDEFGNVKGYLQKSADGKKNIMFKKDDVLHLSLTNIGGSTYGFTPLSTLLNDVATLIYAKDFAGKIFENDGIGSRLFNFPESSGEDDRNVQFLIEQLKLLRKKKNKLRPVVTTGKFEVIDLKNMTEHLQFKELIEQFSTIILFVWQVPPHRVPLLIPRINFDASASDAAYFRSISHIQKIVEDQLASLWAEFNSEIYFNRGYMLDELRQANINAICWDRNAMTIEEGRDLLGLDPKIPKDGTLPQNMKPGIFTSFDEDRDRRVSHGDDYDLTEDDDEPVQDNRVR